MYAGNYNAIVGVIAVDLVTKSKRNKATDPVVSVENSKELSRAPLSTQPYDTQRTRVLRRRRLSSYFHCIPSMQQT